MPPPAPRAGALLALAAVSYLAIAAVLAFYLLPVGFGLEGGALLLGQLVALLGGAALVAYAAVVVRRAVERRERLVALAASMGWGYLADASDRPWGGSIDEQIPRSARRTRDVLDARGTAVPFDAALRVFTVGDGEGAGMHTTLALRIPLPSEAPRIALRSRSGGGPLSVLPRTPRGRLGLRLEGDFSDVFEVSVPSGYERDALYVLTPDLMVVLLDLAPGVDMEIVDGVLHAYLEPADLTEPEGLGRVLSLVAALHERFGRRTLRYRDDAAPPLDPGVYRRVGDTLSSAARALPTRSRIGPVLWAVAAPFVPLLVGVVLMLLLHG